MKRSRHKKNPERDAYREQACQLCYQQQAQHVHEIACGPGRKASLDAREAWLALCPTCHERMHNYADFPPERQCALKSVADPEYFNLGVVNQLRGRAPTAIEWSDVAKYLQLSE